MLVRTFGAKCIGIDAVKVTVEVDINAGIGIHLVGLADAAVKESLLRTITAIESLGYRIPGKKIVINLAPADLHKNGSGYDLPIAVGIMAASGQKELPGLGKYLIMGELGLNGSVRPISGALPFAELARQEGFKGVILPTESAAEALDFSDIRIYAVRSLEDAFRILEEKDDCNGMLAHPADTRGCGEDESAGGDFVDFADIIGQEGAKRGVEIAAAGAHNLIMMGPPGAGKSSLAKALVGILPPMSMEESLVTSKIYSIIGKGGSRCAIARQRPFRAPHYSASLPAIIGGGGGDAIMPGEVSLAHNGVLFLDELGLMPKSVIEALRGPIEDRSVVISRLRSRVRYPASFMLVSASNPCPCGYWGEGERCTCTPAQRFSYLSKLSGPILDRVDIHVWMHPVDSSKILNSQKAEASSKVAERVAAARRRQRERFINEAINTNSEMNNKLTERFCPLSAQCREMLEKVIRCQGLSMRAYFRIIKLARTIADLEASPDIEVRHIAEASGYRFLDRQRLP